jgi:F-type H+-transporting ATPase subunit gamma
MANLKEVRERIQSVMSTQQITKAMKMVSAAKLRRAQGAIVQMRPYSNKLNEMLSNILANIDGDASTAFSAVRPIQSGVIVVVTSSRGLCGAFNSNILKAAVRLIETKYADAYQNGKLTIIAIGKKGNDFFRQRYANKVNLVSDHLDAMNGLTFDKVAGVAQHIIDGFAAKEYDASDIVYARFKNAALQVFETEQFLPVAKIEKADTKSTENTMRADFTFEPDRDTLLEHLIPSILRTQFYKTLLDNHASEHGARMTAMDKATENAEEMLRELRINYNKARQEAITKQLSEIVGGAAALEG